MEAINQVCAYFQNDHDWISQLSLVMQENKNNSDIDVPCVGQWEMFWYSAHDLLNDGVILEKIQ